MKFFFKILNFFDIKFPDVYGEIQDLIYTILVLEI